MSVAAILSSKGRDVVTAKPQATILDISTLLFEKKIGAVVVLTTDGSVCGIASERDVVRQIAKMGNEALNKPVSVCMTHNVISCSEDDSIDAVMEKMSSGRFRHIPVITNGKLAGIVSIGDVVKRKIEQTERDAEELKRYIAG